MSKKYPEAEAGAGCVGGVGGVFMSQSEREYCDQPGRLGDSASKSRERERGKDGGGRRV